jgi:uncharacterized protein YeaO (DUF488 family)
MPVKIKRIYEPPAPDDGQRVLVDRLWPRGVSRADAHVDVWLKDVAPSEALRRWFGHKIDRWADFQERYVAELKTNPAFDELRRLTRTPTTLLYGAKDLAHNQAQVLARCLDGG